MRSWSHHGDLVLTNEFRTETQEPEHYDIRRTRFEWVVQELWVLIKEGADIWNR